MRRLPVYFLIDVSESMVGEPIREVERGLQTILHELRSDPYALETVFIGVLVFAGKAEMVTPLTELILFNPPALPLGSGTNLGEGLEMLMRTIDSEVQKTTPEKKGDWKPIIFLFTDGAPTDNPMPAIDKWKNKYAGKCNLVIVTFGPNADITLLEKTGGQVLTLGQTTPEDFREFFKWVSASLQASSMSVAESGQEGLHLADNSRINLEKAQPTQNIDENFAILSLKCSHNKEFWLAKYKKASGGSYTLEGGYLVDEEIYNRLGGAAGSAASMDVAALDDIPVCPSCRKSDGLAQCSCGKLFCTGEEREVTCPWCGAKGTLTRRDSFDIARNRG